MALNENIRIAREKKNLTQIEFGKLIGVSNTVISNWEKGINKPDADMLCKICYALDVDANFLLDYPEKETKQDSTDINLTPDQLTKLSEFIDTLKKN